MNRKERNREELPPSNSSSIATATFCRKLMGKKKRAPNNAQVKQNSGMPQHKQVCRLPRAVRAVQAKQPPGEQKGTTV